MLSWIVSHALHILDESLLIREEALGDIREARFPKLLLKLL
jgi:hypothetical protein